MFEEDIEILSDYQVQENKILEIVPAIQSYSLTVLEWVRHFKLLVQCPQKIGPK